ncbi:pentatricopeptide repeat-containing protein At2g17525, mitochondrial [Mercurialis annua]|uniref:pentatricopeptide repeat-containing protein At2g17525, mitochondrial n=1 Tax=Mercurialis annua TaxID=3986 RepID=UPI00215FAE19|nr:pentatricopeptide repeat-containing protein At2g17525, mitochondrial [Mercurialis annua]
MPKSFPLSKLKTICPKLLDIFQFRQYSSSSLYVPSHEHIAHLILDQNSAPKALQTFTWASNLPNFTHSQSTYQALIQKLSSFRRFDIVYQVLDEMPHSIGSPPDEPIFLTIIRGLGRARMIPDVIKVLDLIAKFGKTPSLKIFNSILDVLVKVDIDLAREFYRKKMMKSGAQGDDYTFGILMKGLCSTNRIGDGFKLLQVMKCGGMKPNAVVYNTLLHALCKNGKIGRARSLMDEIEQPNDVTFNVLISGYCKEDNLVQALVMLEKSFSAGFVPDIVAVTKVVEILCNAGRTMEAVEILERIESKGGVVDVVAYNTLLKGFCRLGKTKVAVRFLNEMERKGCLPNVDTYNTLISGFCDSGMFVSALDMFNDMKSDGIRWTFDTYDTLIKGLFSGGRIEEGFKILELMEESKGGSNGRISPYNSVLYGLYKKNMWDEALEFLMKMENLFPRAVNRSLSILSFCEKGDIENAKAVFDQMTNEGGIPSVIVYDCLIHGFCQKGSLLEAFELTNEMIGRGYFPVALLFNSLINGLCWQGKGESALKVLDEMVEQGCIPDGESYSVVIDTLCKKGNLQKSVRVLHQMIEKGIIPDSMTWNSLLICLTVWSEFKNVFHVNKLLELLTNGD